MGKDKPSRPRGVGILILETILRKIPSNKGIESNNILTSHVSISKLQQISVYDQFYFSVFPLIAASPDYFEANPRHISNIILDVNISGYVSRR